MDLALLAFAQDTAAPGGAVTGLVAILPYFLMFLIFYVIWWLPVKRKQKAMDALLAALKKGDKVITNGGLYGEVAKVEGDVVFLKVNDTTKVRVARRAIAGLEGAPATGAAPAAES